jgi:hypothetical protein
VVALSPGEYLKHIDVAATIAAIKVPIFVTSAKKEADDLAKLVTRIDPKYITKYVPASEGAHGARSQSHRAPKNIGMLLKNS